MIHPVALRAPIAGLLLSLAGPPEARADRAAVEAALAGMTRAVLAADRDAYLAHVSNEDPVFFKEQFNWARDLGRVPAAEFSLSVDDAAPAQFEDHAATFTLVTKWRMKGWDEKSSRTLTFPAGFARVGDKWLYRGERWDVIEGEGVKVLFAPAVGDASNPLAQVAQRVVNVMPAVRAHVEEGYQTKGPAVQEVKLYADMKHLQASIYLSYTDGLGGWNEPEESIKILAGEGQSEAGLKVLLGHEFGHVATFTYGAHASDMPWWVLEGAAELAAEQFSASRTRTDRTVRAWAKAGSLAKWEDMADFHKTEPRWMGHVYTQGHHMLGFVSDQFGRERRNAWLRLLAQGKDLDAASLGALGQPFAEVDSAWRASLATPPRPDPEPQK